MKKTLRNSIPKAVYFLSALALAGCAKSGSGGGGGTSATVLSCSNYTDFNTSVDAVVAAAAPCFFVTNYSNASTSPGTMNTSTNTCTNGTKVITFTSPTYSAWNINTMTLRAAFKTAGVSCLDIYSEGSSTYIIKNGSGATIYQEVPSTSTTGSIQFISTSWTYDTATLSACGSSLKTLGRNSGTGGSPPAASSSILLGIFTSFGVSPHPGAQCVF